MTNTFEVVIVSERIKIVLETYFVVIIVEDIVVIKVVTYTLHASIVSELIVPDTKFVPFITMEFPHIGRNCSYKSCNKLDFLPMKCDACKEVYCSDHYTYIKHECPASSARDVQVPQCPLCGSPVPGKRDEPPDVAVSAHIDNQCMSDPARERRNKVFTNKCSYKGCKTKEMVPLVCAECSLNYCLRHRHTVDHACDGKLGAKKRQAANAAMARMRQNEKKVPDRTTVASIASFTAVQGNMTEDEALAHALALSMQEQGGAPTRETTIIRELARQRVGGEQNSRCSVS